MARDKLDAFANLVKGGASAPPGRTQLSSSGDEGYDGETIQKVLDLVAGITTAISGEENLFEMQELIEACAQEMREQIRESVEGEDE